jgi:F0F1-type ATP synthase assembly protein I
MDWDPDKRYRYLRLVGSLGTIPVMMGVGPLLGYYAGSWLDARLSTAPWLMIFMIILGFAAAVRYVVRLIRQVQKDIDRM